MAAQDLLGIFDFNPNEFSLNSQAMTQPMQVMPEFGGLKPSIDSYAVTQNRLPQTPNGTPDYASMGGRQINMPMQIQQKQGIDWNAVAQKLGQAGAQGKEQQPMPQAQVIPARVSGMPSGAQQAVSPYAPTYQVPQGGNNMDKQQILGLLGLL